MTGKRAARTTKVPRTAGQKNRPGGGRPAEARPCVVCQGDAIYAAHVLTRTIGPGQGRATRKMKMSPSVLFCGRCARQVKTFIAELSDAAQDAMGHVIRKQVRPSAPGLFDQAEAS